MDTSVQNEKLWVLFTLDKRQFAVASDHLQQILPLPEVRCVPGVPPYMRGVICYRNNLVPLMDLRARLGIASLTAESAAFEAMIRERERDHQNWVRELLASVKERRDFTLATDPHKCAFGRWYDSYHSDDAWVAGWLRKFDEPHERIHGLAVTVNELKAKGDYENAESLVNGTGGATLGQLGTLFEGLISTLRDRYKELVMVLSVSNRSLAITADATLGIERLQQEQLPAGAIAYNDRLVNGCASRKSGDVCLLVDADALINAAQNLVPEIQVAG